MNKVELLPAFRWICPECGEDHFERAICPSLTEEEKADMKEAFGEDEFDE